MLLDPKIGTISYSYSEVKSIQTLLQEIRNQAMIDSRFDEVEKIKELATLLGVKLRVSKD